ncbi:hypothetical protein IFM89_036334 [Coptis chinensis]|uniref:Uncharacterized protein n=1 Tax=Coptis chinensis TaxID=261450 RepID=A0A835IKN9_9MAGN|nr:hypothetical protein IFM89_036334 [Coptis chinensis]
MKECTLEAIRRACDVALNGTVGLDILSDEIVSEQLTRSWRSWEPSASMLLRSRVGRLLLVDFDRITFITKLTCFVAAREDVGIPKALCLRSTFQQYFREPNRCKSATVKYDRLRRRTSSGHPRFCSTCIDNIDTKVIFAVIYRWISCSSHVPKLLKSTSAFAGLMWGFTQLHVRFFCFLSLLSFALPGLCMRYDERYHPHVLRASPKECLRAHDTSRFKPMREDLTKCEPRAASPLCRGIETQSKACFHLKGSLQDEENPSDYQLFRGFESALFCSRNHSRNFWTVMASLRSDRAYGIACRTEPIVNLDLDHYRILHQRLIEHEEIIYGTSAQVQVWKFDVLCSF